MREKTEAAKKAKADAANAPPIARRQTMAKKIASEEKRMETGSQVPGAQLSFAE